MSNILELVKSGPVPVRSLRGRGAAFRNEYARLLREGKVVLHGVGTKCDPLYVGLPGANFPERKQPLNPADVCLLMLAGATEEGAREALMTAISTGGEEEVARVCERATQYIIDRGLNPVAEIRRAVNRRRNGKPLMPLHTEYDITGRLLNT